MQTKARYSMGLQEWALLITLSILWGGSFFFSKIALGELRPFTIVFARVSLAALILNMVLLATGQRLPAAPKRWAAFVVMGALNNVIPFSLIFWGQTQITSGMASILNATTPLCTILLAHFLTRDERLTWRKGVGVLFGLLGVVTLIGWKFVRGLQGNLWAELAVLGAAIAYACAGIFGKRLSSISPLVVATGQLTCATIWMLPIVLLLDRSFMLSIPSRSILVALMALAVLSTALAYLIYFRLLALVGASNLLLVTFLIPVSALTLGALILSESISLRQLAGMALIGIGLLWIDGRLLSRFHNTRRAAPSHRYLDDYQI